MWDWEREREGGVMKQEGAIEEGVMREREIEGGEMKEREGGGGVMKESGEGV